MEIASHPRISILMPVFNGSRYLPKTLDSILGQTFSDYEVLCINDCSTDDSLKILERYGAVDSRFRVLSTPVNQGIVPKVANWAMPYMRGDYCFYTSQDDLFSPDLLQSMWDTAMSTGADAVIPEVVLYHESEPQENITITAPNGNKSTVLTNREAVILTLDWTIPGNALFAAKLAKGTGCYDFSLNADEYTTRVLLFHSNKVVFSGGTFYYRQDNLEAITRKLSSGTFDYPYTDFRLYEFLREHDFPDQVQEQVLLRSIAELSDLTTLLNKLRVKRLIRGQIGDPLNIGEADRRLKRCFDALRESNAPAQLSRFGSAIAGRSRILLANYALFRAISLIAMIAQVVKSRLRIRGSQGS